mgnify:CR=1 FL=1
MDVLSILENDEYSKNFQLFCKKENNEENILFLADVRKYKKIKSFKRKVKYARMIEKKYLKPTSPRELNLSPKDIKPLTKVLSSKKINRNVLDENFFELIENKIKYLLHDVFARYSMTDQYKKDNNNFLKKKRKRKLEHRLSSELSLNDL